MCVFFFASLQLKQTGCYKDLASNAANGSSLDVTTSHGVCEYVFASIKKASLPTENGMCIYSVFTNGQYLTGACAFFLQTTMVNLLIATINLN